MLANLKGLSKKELQQALSEAVEVVNNRSQVRLAPSPVATSIVRCGDERHKIILLNTGALVTPHHPVGPINEEKVLRELGDLRGSLRCAEVVRMWREYCSRNERPVYEFDSRFPKNLRRPILDLHHIHSIRLGVKRGAFTKASKFTRSMRGLRGTNQRGKALMRARVFLGRAEWLWEAQFAGRITISDALPTQKGSGCALLRLQIERRRSLEKESTAEALFPEGTGWYLIRGEEVLAGPLTSRDSWDEAYTAIKHSHLPYLEKHNV